MELDEVGSTNAWLMERAEETPDGLWLRAERQTAGRGRRGRSWSQQSGNLAASTLVRPAAVLPAQQLSFVAALALDDALAGWVAPQRRVLKWPNDLLLDGCKLAGILLERSGQAVVIGFGVNLVDYPGGVHPPATSLAAAGIDPPSAVQLLAALRESFTAWRLRWQDWGFEPVRTRFLERAHGLGARLVARLSDGTELTGSFDGLDGDGALRLRLDGGTIRAIHAADVFAL